MPPMCSNIFSTWTRRRFRPLANWKKSINPHTIASLNDALIIMEKEINELTDALYGRNFTEISKNKKQMKSNC